MQELLGVIQGQMQTQIYDAVKRAHAQIQKGQEKLAVRRATLSKDDIQTELKSELLAKVTNAKRSSVKFSSGRKGKQSPGLTHQNSPN